MSTFLLQPGLVVATPAGPAGLGTHVGIVTDAGTIISCSLRRGGVAEESPSEFSGGAPITPIGYPGNLPPLMVIARARMKIGTPWKLFSFNCEHFVNWAHGVEVQSPQLRMAVAFLALFAIVGGLALKRA